MISQANIQGRLNALMQAGRAVASCADLDQVLQNVVHEAAAISGAPFVRLFLLDEASQILHCRVGVGLPSGEEKGLVVPLGQSLSGEVIATGRPLAIPDTRGDPRLLLPLHAMKWGLISYLGIPLTVENRPAGVLVFNTREARAYTEEEIAYLSCFADHAALAIVRARLHERAKADATELEARVKGRTIELEEALRVKEEFLTRMSHEFRTPLNFVLGFADLLVRETAGPLTLTQARYLNRIQMGGQHLLDLVNNLLDLASPAIRAKLRRARFPLREILQDILDLLQPQIAAKRLKVMVAVSPIFQVVADRSKLAQVLRHLLENAVKFTPDGGHVSLAARELADDRPHPDLPAGRVVEISVADSGVGIVAKDLGRVFGAFEQVDGSSERAHDGSGLGLTLVRKLVELHGGVVWAESPGVGHGTRIIVRLPQGGVVPATKQILVVEDDPTILRFYSVFLGEAGYGVTAVGTAGAALSALQTISIDLIVLDLGLPDRPGIDVLTHVRTDPKTQAVPVLVLTGRGDTEIEEALREGASECLTKPTTGSALIHMVDTLLEQARGRTALDTADTERETPGASDGN
jgi:signal transduction histidine kinase/ActR/RegA family two-component response regulator